MKKQNKNIQTTIPRVFIWLFVFSAISIVLVQFIIQLINFKSYFTNVPGGIEPEMLWVLFYSSLMPVLFFMMAFLISPRKHMWKVSHVYENLIIGVPALLIYSMLEAIWMQLQSSFRVTNGSFISYWLSQIIILVSVLILYSLLLTYLRRRKIWR